MFTESRRKVLFNKKVTNCLSMQSIISYYAM